MRPKTRLVNDPQLVPLGADLPATTSDAERTTTGSSLLVYQTDSGAIHASLRYARVRRMRIEFTLDVVNATDEPLLATIYALAKSGDEIPVAPFAFWIDKRTEAYLDLPVSWLTALSCRAISVRLQGRNAHQRLEASMPRPTAIGWFAAGLALASILALGFSLAQPRILNLSAPASAVSGSRINVAFAFAGLGTHEWEIDDLSGGRIDGGAVEGPQDLQSIPVPKVNAQTPYALRLVNRGPLGTAVEERPLVVTTARPPVPPPQILSLALDDSRVPDGSAVTVRYKVSGQYGDVIAVDAQGTVWAQKPLDPQGLTTLQLPHFGRDKELQVRVVARRGDAETSSGIGLQVLASSTPAPDESASSNSPVEVLDAAVQPGGFLHLSVSPDASDLFITLSSESGAVLAQATPQVTGGQSVVAVPLTASGKLVVVAKYRRGDREEAIVRAVPVR